MAGTLIYAAFAITALRADTFTAAAQSGSSACLNVGESSAICSTAGSSYAASSIGWGVDQAAGGLALVGSLRSANSFTPDLASASLSASIDLPSSSLNWVVTGILSEQSDDNAMNGPGQLAIYSNGELAGYIASGSDPSMILIHHQAGTPITLSLSARVNTWNAFSSDTLNFSLGFVDPPEVPASAAPEPSYLYIVPFFGVIFGILLRRYAAPSKTLA